MRPIGALAALAAGLALVPGVAHAQANDEIVTRVGIIEPLTITKLADLDFGDIIPSTGGMIVLSPTASASCTVTGAVIHSGACMAAQFAGSGTSGQQVRVRRPAGRTITLNGPGADMIVSDITINGNPALNPVRSNPNWERFRIGSGDGIFVFRVGGTLTVNPDQAPGVYTGTFDIRLDYQ